MTPDHLTDTHECPASKSRAWWREPYVWLVISIPVATVVACLVTMYYIMR